MVTPEYRMNISRRKSSPVDSISIVAFACAVATFGLPRVARACSIAAPDPTLIGMPADGDRGVPTDVVPYYRIPVGFSSSDGTVPGTFTLTSANGTPIALTAKEADNWNF